MWWIIIATTALSLLAYKAMGEQVSASIVLAADVSTSIDQTEFKLQREGYARAITSNEFLRAVRLSEQGRVALAYVEWASAESQITIVPCRVIHDAESARRFTQILIQAPRPFGGGTALGAALRYSATVATTCPGGPRIIDISGDGVNNEGENPSTVRDELVGRGITINALPILGEEVGVAEFYRENVVGGPRAFSLPVEGWEQFAHALINKLILEIANAN